jgi:hypothetical protein
MAQQPPIKMEGFLVVRADGTMRTTKKRVALGMDEVAFQLTVTIPRMWGRVQSASIDINMPEPPESRVTIGEGEMD